MKVLHVGKYFPPHYGGIETFMSQLMEEQAQQGLEISAIVHADTLQSNTGHYVWNGCSIYEVKSYGKLVFAPVAPCFPFKLWKVLQEQKPDVIHVHMPNVSAFWLLFFWVLIPRKTRLFVHWHSDVIGAQSTIALKLLYPVYRIFEVALLRLCRAIIATSPPYLQSSKALAGFKDKCVVIPLGITIDSVASPKAPRSDTEKALKLLMIGRLTFYKGHEQILEALATLKSSNLDLQLNIIGTGELWEHLQEKTQKLNLQAHVNWLGKVAEADKIRRLKEADILLLPSIERTEAFGVVIMEAAAYGLPAVVSDVAGSGMSYVVVDGETGYVIKNNDVNAVTEVFAKIGEEPDKLYQLGKNAYCRLKQKFDIKVVARQIHNLYKRVE